MYRFLLSRQWVILTLLALVLMPVMVQLGFWQLHRHEARVAHNELIAGSLAAEPVPVAELTGVGRMPAEDDMFRRVTATGVYDTAHEVVVRRRTAADGREIGYFVLTPLIRADGTALLVNRGWVPGDGDQRAFPEVPGAPGGTVTVTGRLLRDETTAATGIKDRGGLPERQVMLINSEQRAAALERPVLGGFVELTATAPRPAEDEIAEQVPEPDHSGVGAHLAYAIQWWLFTAAVPVGWVILLRRELRDRRAAARRADEGAPATGPALARAAAGTAD
ncbi:MULTISPECIES: SURF1 family cytochrome oxidase biogenesis protein [unclassified Streptomyces]|uniref:SURF1 family cytochrome oxidase biogenesis protein n=1 Tax=unclassified Streptomyces TaxID=2593676 RepID=UPI0022B74C9F|nr:MULTISPECIES: SURF1 family protein [unclassified Streptomyces]MCZ7413562.1 SURF1 family protein [Streptomyces sp. WMMC897]MCZ7430557.1 SURF1 family protein [Streptomyces sp. WMMC1477]